ncbi:hypothetical protein [Roseateles amylovorans]|uniref:L,D-transpeptidase n=1 Tax=Roseateles amylovorans TaxID=2978473 RepID=A0ABY6B1E3_9BURK|nr:hypothetical protein [Roseateles amylovorans]UXH79215.1 hypothetical protein N4261_04570 [Roseateles amylovorans]
MLRASSGYETGDPPDEAASPVTPMTPATPASPLRERAGWALQGLGLGVVAALLAWPVATYVMKQVRHTPPAVVASSSPVRPVVQAPAPVPRSGTADFGKTKASLQARQLAQWVMAGFDHGGRPFAILDKRQAQVFVFYPDGKLAGSTPVLLGYASGDDSVAGIGLRPIAEVRPSERTTPAGRFIAQPGKNALHEDVLWVDYDAAVSMHRVRVTNPAERRLERLATPSPKDNRISYGCINMPVKFFENQLWPILGKRGGIVYVLPEKKTVETVFADQMRRAKAGQAT